MNFLFREGFISIENFSNLLIIDMPNLVRPLYVLAEMIFPGSKIFGRTLKIFCEE